MDVDAEAGFGLHGHRDALKLLEQDRETVTLDNRGSLTCPACGKPFDRLFVSEKRANTFGDPGTAFCLVRTDHELLPVTH